jgi:hypothetical protein
MARLARSLSRVGSSVSVLVVSSIAETGQQYVARPLRRIAGSASGSSPHIMWVKAFWKSVLGG